MGLAFKNSMTKGVLCFFLAMGAFFLLGLIPQTYFRSIPFLPPVLGTVGPWEPLDSLDGYETLRFSTHVNVPPECAQQKCALLFDQVGDVGILYLDGKQVASLGSYPRILGAQSKFSMLAKLGTIPAGIHELEMHVFRRGASAQTAAAPQTWILKEELGVDYVRASTMSFVFLPIGCSMGLLGMALVVLVALINSSLEWRLGCVFIAYCLANSLAYLLFSDVLHNLIPLHGSAPIYLSLRNLANLTFFALCILSLEFKPNVRRVVRVGFLASALATLCFCAIATWLGASAPTLEMVRSLHVVGHLFTPLKFSAFVVCFLGCVASAKDQRFWLPSLVFAGLLLVTANDEIAILGYPYRSYVAKFHALIAGGVFLEVFLRRRTQRSTELRMQADSDESLGLLARRVAHDIRSPLAALAVVVEAEMAMSRDTRDLVTLAVGRLNSIAGTLLQERPQSGDTDEGFALGYAISTLITEKKMEFGSHSNVTIVEDYAPQKCWVLASETEFQRALSNIVNNAAEAMVEGGTITVSTRVKGNRCYVEISDTGKGIPGAILSRLKRAGFSYGKESGNGLGIAHARRFCKEADGILSLRSKVGVGTTVTLALPAHRQNLQEALVIPPSVSLTVIDDDDCIHSMWENRVRSASRGKHVVINHVRSAGEAALLTREEATIYLVDYSLNWFSFNGLDLIHEKGLAKQAILVTGESSNAKVRKRSKVMGVPLLPKSIAGSIPISLGSI